MIELRISPSNGGSTDHSSGHNNCNSSRNCLPYNSSSRDKRGIPLENLHAEFEEEVVDNIAEREFDCILAVAAQSTVEAVHKLQ